MTFDALVDRLIAASAENGYAPERELDYYAARLVRCLMSEDPDPDFTEHTRVMLADTGDWFLRGRRRTEPEAALAPRAARGDDGKEG